MVDIVAVILDQTLTQITAGERRLCLDDALGADRLVDGVRGQGDDGAQRFGIGGGLKATEVIVDRKGRNSLTFAAPRR